MSDNKNVRLVNLPGSADWPHPPVYESPWPPERIKGAVIVFEATLFQIVRDYDALLDKAQFDLWAMQAPFEIGKIIDDKRVE